MKSPNDIAVYVIVDKNLSSGLKATQALHAAVELTYSHKPAEDWVLNHKTVVILESSLDYLRLLQYKVELEGFKTFPFIDTDLGPDITAVAFSPMRRDGRENRFFRDLPLAKFS
jgi:hypothetical protein